MDDCGSDDCGSDDWDDPGLTFCTMDCSCGFDDCISSGLEDGSPWFSLIISEMVSFNLGKIADMQMLTNWSMFEEGVEVYLSMDGRFGLGGKTLIQEGVVAVEMILIFSFFSVLKPSYNSKIKTYRDKLIVIIDTMHKLKFI